MYQKEFILSIILVFSTKISYSQHNTKNNNYNLMIKNDINQDSVKFLRTLKTLCFDSNDRDSDLTHNVYELVFGINSTLDLNDKLPLMCFFIARHDMNFYEFWYLIKAYPDTQKSKMDKFNEIFIYLFTPFKEFPEDLKIYNVDQNVFNIFSVENQLLLKQIDSFLKSEHDSSINQELAYQLLLLNFMKTSTCLKNNFSKIKN
jgi:hypothetical protein